MEKIINIDGKDVKFSCNASFVYRYKLAFGKDIMKVIFPLLKTAVNFLDGDLDLVEVLNDLIKTNIESVDLLDIVWVLAKTGDPNIPEAIEWYGEFTTFPILEVSEELLPILIQSLSSTKESKKKIQEVVGK